MSFGAQTGLQAFFISRYFGLKAYGTIYGASRALFLVGSGLGPFLAGLSFDLWGSYRPALMAFGVGLLIVTFTFVLLGPYKFGPRDRVARGTPTPLVVAPIPSRAS